MKKDRKRAQVIDVLIDEALSAEQILSSLRMMADDGNEDAKADVPKWRTYLEMLYHRIGMQIVEGKRMKQSEKYLKNITK